MKAARRRFTQKCISSLIIPSAFLFSNAALAVPVESASPYATMPLNLEGATFVPPNVMLLLDISGSMCLYPNSSAGGTDCAYLSAAEKTSDPQRRISIATNVAKDLFRNNTNVRWGFSVFSSSGGRAGTFNNIVVPIGDYTASHLSTLLDRADYWWENAWGQTYMYEAYNKAVNYYANQYASTSGYGSPVQYRCQKNNLILVGDGAPTDSPLSSMTALGTVSPSTFAEMSRMAYEGDLGLTGNDLDGKPFNSSDYPRQYMSTYTVGFAVNLAIFKQAAEAGGGMYFTTSDATGLTEALQTSLNDIVSKTSSTPAPVSVMQPTTGTIQIGFNTEGWSGTVKTYPVDGNGNINYSSPSEAVVPTTRMIFTSYGSGSARTYTKIDPTNSTLLADTTTFGSNPEWTLRFLTGEEPSGNTTWRKRNGKLLGDFIHTEPVSLNNGNDFVAGSNDGLVHYFRRNNSNHPYSELFAYAPSATLSKIQHVASRNYGQTANPHRYLVDGAIATQDLNMGSGADKTILAGALGRGGKGLYALDLSKATANSPNGIATNVGLWDYNSEDIAYVGFRGSNLGYTFGRPVIAKVKQPGASRWMVIAGNGYDSTSAHAAMTNLSSIYFLDATTKTIMGNVLIPTSGSNPGIGDIAVMDKDNDGVADIVYATDRNGDVWRVDLEEELHGTNADPAKNTKVYKLWSGDPSQPITMSPTLYRINNDEVMVLFGTGSMLLSTDKTSTVQQSVYGIRDNISAAPITYSYATDRAGTGRLIQQTILEEKNDSSGEVYRKVSQNAKPSDGSKSGGWYLDLKADGASAERVTQPMSVLSNGVFFTTQIPTTAAIDTCNAGSGDGWVMALSAATGSAPLKAVFSPANVNFTGGASTVAGLKTNNMGMPSALGLNVSNTQATWSTYSSLSGMINNQANYLGTGLRGYGVTGQHASYIL